MPEAGSCSLQIIDCGFNDGDFFLKGSDADIASKAEDPSDDPGFVVMVHNGTFPVAGRKVRFPADSTYSTLAGKHGVESLFCQTVFFSKIVFDAIFLDVARV